MAKGKVMTKQKTPEERQKELEELKKRIAEEERIINNGVSCAEQLKKLWGAK